MDLGLHGRVALVVGGSGRIGSAAARHLVAEGATVVLAARTADSLEAAAAAIGASSIVMDTHDDASVAHAVDEVIGRHGRLDVAVITAAPAAPTLDPARDREPDHILQAIDGKALGFLRVADAVLPHLTAAGHGRIVGVSGQRARLTGSITAALRNLSLNTIAKSLADAVAGSGVSVNVVNPGGVVDATGHPAPKHGLPGESTYDEVGALIAFLCSSHAAAISGAEIAAGHTLRGITT